MIQISRILCPVDFSDASRRALDYAVVLARWYESQVTVLHVAAITPLAPIAPYPGTMPPDLVGLTEAARQQLQADLERFVQAERAAGVPIEAKIAEGDAAREILRAAEALPADLIVMGTHGRSGFDRWLLGSVTEKVIRKTTAPMLTVPPHMPDAVPVGPGFKRILCPIDFSPASKTALTYATSLAQEADAHLMLIHVLELPPETSYGAPPFDAEAYTRTYEEESKHRLRALVPDEVRTYCTVEEMAVTGKPYQEILRVAKEQAVELIVLGVHGRGAADRLLFGSTTQHVVRQATCPVMTLRQP